MPVNIDNRHQLSDKIKYLFWMKNDHPAQGVLELRPYLYFEVRVDFNDVRTGFRETASLSKALEIYSNTAELLWTDDMIRDVDLGDTISSIPEGVRLGMLPGFVDANFISRMENQFSQYLLRSFETRIYRNFDLNIYSFSGESRADFMRRCLELYDAHKRHELDHLHDVFTRRLEQARQKYLISGDSNSLEQTRTESQNKDVFSRCSERIAELFLQPELVSSPVSGVFTEVPGMPELEIRLSSLELESRQAILKLTNVYAEKAQAIDEYILHPNLRDIHFVRSCILWMPEGAV